MEITRNQIETEENYKKLQAIGRAYRKDGHKLVLNAPEDDLRARLLNIYDNHYAVNEPEAELPPVIIDMPTSGPKPEVVEDADPEPDAVVPKEKLYITLRAFRDWASGWSFTPGMDEPKPLPKKLTPGLKSSLKDRTIIPYDG